MGKACLAIWGKRMDFRFSVGCSEKKVFGYLCESNTKKNETLANFPSYLISLKGRKTRFNPSIQYSTLMKYHGKSATSLPTHVLYWGYTQKLAWLKLPLVYASMYREKKYKFESWTVIWALYWKLKPCLIFYHLFWLCAARVWRKIFKPSLSCMKASTF